MTTVLTRRGMGATVLEDLASGFSDSLKTDATDWLLRQYSGLLQVPAQIARLRTLAARLETIVIASSGAADLRGQVDAATPKLADLSARYQPMMTAVQAAYSIINDAGAGIAPAAGQSLFTAATGSIAAILQAQQYMAELNDVDQSLRSVIDQLIGLGVMTADQASNLLAATSSPTIPWGKIVMWGGGALLAYKIFSGRGR